MPLRRTPDGALAVIGDPHGSSAWDRLNGWLYAFAGLYHLPDPEHEYQFEDGRRWRFDWAWPKHRVAVELDGGTWARGRHTRGLGFERDCWKLSTAAADGWRVLRFTPRMVEQQWSACEMLLRHAFEAEDLIRT